jgi:hypothetical protein
MCGADVRAQTAAYGCDDAQHATRRVAEDELTLGAGLAYGQEPWYEGAASHFARAQELLVDGDGVLREALAEFLDCYAHYRQAQQALNDAGRRFAAADSELAERLGDSNNGCRPTCSLSARAVRPTLPRIRPRVRCVRMMSAGLRHMRPPSRR